MDHGRVPKSQVNCIPPRTTWKSNSPSRLKENYGRQSKPPSAFQFLKRTLRCHEASKPFRAGSTDRLDGARAGCHEKYFLAAAGRRGDVFLDSPFQRTLGDFWGLINTVKFAIAAGAISIWAASSEERLVARY